MATIYWGEVKCEAFFRNGKPCTNRAYYTQEGESRCGVHSKKTTRLDLPKNPDAAKLLEEARAEREIEVMRQAKVKKAKGLKGEVTVTKIRMMKPPIYLEGYRCIFPNYRHQGRSDGFGCASLSPKSMGPIDHGMPGIPVAKNLENYHQGAKFWPFEFDEKDGVKKAFKKKRKDMYRDPFPYRHKWARKELEAYGKNVNIPKCSIYYTKDRKERRYTYLECRYFYCHWYQRIALETNDFRALKKMMDEGISLNIVGYDGYPPSDKTPEALWAHYNDTSKPFGHELVLFSLLVLEKDEDYPWNRFYRENYDLYKDVI